MAWQKAKPMSKEMMLNAMKKTKSIRAAARYLGCSYQHLKPYMKAFRIDDNDPNSPTLFEAHKNRQGKGIPKQTWKKTDRAPVAQILSGEIDASHFDINKIKRTLIVDGYLAEECCKCGFCERRLSDYKMPLLLNFKDKNRKHYSLENLELVCYNCYYLYVDNVFTPKQERQIEDMPKGYRTGNAPEKTEWDLDNHILDNMRAMGIDI